MNAVTKIERFSSPSSWNPSISDEGRKEIELEVIRLYQNFIVDIMLERVGNLFILRSEVDELVRGLAEFISISVYDSAELLHRVKRQVVSRMKEVRP
jgi:hypothetical protein